MTTAVEQQYQQEVQTMINLGFSREMIQRQLQLRLAEDQARVAQAEAQRRERDHPPPAFDFARIDAQRQRELAWLANLGSAAQDAADDARDEAEIRQIDAEIERLTAPLRQRRAAAVARREQRRFQG